jgi:nicotinate phosphoribosyltransferase
VEVLPNNCIFLVDTYDTLDGVRHAIEAGRRLRDRGHEMIGVRLDSGDLAYLSIEARRMLDDAGFPEAKIVASNDLDERLITSLKQQGAKIDIWGVGTRLVTAYDQPALGGVYKLTAIRRAGEPWQPKIKLSEQSAKVNTPGILQVRRFTNNDRFVGDAIYDEQIGLELPTEIVDPADPLRRKRLASGVVSEDLLRPIFRRGECIYDEPSLPAMQARTRAQLQALHPTIRRFDHPHAYPAGLEARLHEHKLRMIDAARSHVSKQGDA